MKKSKLAEIKERAAKTRQVLADIRDRPGEFIDEKRDQISAQARSKWEKRWRQRTEEVTGEPCERWEDIKFDD